MPAPRPDFASAGFDLPLPSLRLGPFPGRDFLALWWEQRAADRDALHLVEGDRALIPLWSKGGALMMAGEADLTDYHSPRGEGAARALAAHLDGWASGTPFRFDSLPAEAAAVMAQGLAGAGLAVDPVEHATAMVLPLPGDFDTYLAGLAKKERHEMRRKLRRYEEKCGPATVERNPPGALPRFIDLHRTSPGRKGRFMTPSMAGFFEALTGLAETRLDVLHGAGGVVAAVAFGFCDGDAYYLYNSAYDPGMADLSPGMVLLSLLVAGAIEEGLAAFDFLKGDEPYKHRLGAVRRPLYVLEGRT